MQGVQESPDRFDGLQFGCVVFDDPRSREQGWKAIGEEKATRVSMEGTSSLRSDVVWLTNMTYEASSVMGLRDNYRFLQSGYLREDLIEICKRHKIPDNRAAAELGAKLLSRSMHLSAKLLEADRDFPVRSALRNGFREIVGFGKNPCVSIEMKKIIDDASVYNTNCERDWNQNREDDIIAIYRIPPREHCLGILASPLPYGDFNEVPKSALPSKGASRNEIQDFLRNTAKSPGFFKITCERFNPEFNSLINFGDSPSPYGAYRRSWVTLPEAIMLSSLGDIVIHQAFLPTNSYRLTTAADIATKLPAQVDLSMTVGIFFENLWTGMSVSGKALCQTDPNKIYINTFTPFIRAMDRLRLFDKAILFKQAGFEVQGYATGRLRVNIAGKDPKEAYNIALKTRTIPPFLGIKADSMPPLTDEEMNDPIRFQQVWHATDNLEQMLEWDSKVVNFLLAR